MKKVLVDSNVLLDVFTEDSVWFEWSSEQLELLANQHMLAVNPIIYAEISLCFGSVEALEEALPVKYFERLALPMESAFLAGKIFLKYRQAGGKKSKPLPDFFIGAHAAVEDLILLTRDRGYQSYFPKLEIISPVIS